MNPVQDKEASELGNEKHRRCLELSDKCGGTAAPAASGRLAKRAWQLPAANELPHRPQAHH